MKNNKILLLLHFLSLLVFLPDALLAQEGINITNGASITVTGSATISISNGGFINNGTYSKGNETVTFSGNTAKTISGSSATSINNLSVSSTGGITTQLGQLTTNNLTIGTGSKFTVDPAKSVTVNGSLTNNSGSAAGLVLKSTSVGTASLLHNTENVQATIERYVTGSSSLSAMMYHMVSVPLTPSTASTSNLFLGSYLFDFSEGTNSWNGLGGSTTNMLDETRGYLTYYPLGPNTTYIFAGAMNNGSVTPFEVLTTGSTNDNTHGWNLVPNPFPSAIDWNASGWTKTNIDGSIYFWPSGKASDAGNYATWNGTSGTGTPAPGTQFIPAGQSFFVHANAASPQLKMDNNVRVHNTQAFWKNGELVPNQLRLKTAVNEAYDDLIVQFREDASEGFDTEFDAYKMQGGSNAPQLSSLASDGNSLSINNLPFSSGDVIVPLNFSFSSVAEVTFTASNLESFNSSTTIFLEDLLLNKMADLRQDPVYIFAYEPGNALNRFQLRLSVITGVEKHTDITLGTAFVSNGNMYVQVPEMDGQMAGIVVYNSLGQQLVCNKQVLSGITKVQIPENAAGIYIVRINSGKQLFTAKIVIKQ